MKFLLAVILFLSFGTYVFAEDVSLIDPLSLVVVPETPGPGEKVNISIESSSLDLDQSQITWRANGNLIKSGRGVKSVEITNGPLGSATTVTVSVSGSSGSASESTTLSSGSVDLIWQGNTYAPPFYKGLSLWTHGARVTILAVPHIISGGAEINPGNLTYRWSQNGEVLGNSSGAGKNTLTFYDSVLSLPQEISVDILTDRDTVAATGALTLTAGDPKALVYEDNPLLGLLFQNEVGNKVTLKEKEVSFAAFPMFFSTSGRNQPNISYNWSTNNGTSQNGSRITFRTPDGSGESAVGVSLENSTANLQSASKNFNISFGGNSIF